MPQLCSSLAYSLPWTWISSYESRCTPYFPGSLSTLAKTCFPSKITSATKSTDIYNCLAALPIYCTFYTPPCSTNTYTVGNVPTPTPSSYVANPGFETGDASLWTESLMFGAYSYGVTNSFSHSGNYSFQSIFTGPTNGLYLTQSVSVYPTATYALSMWYYQTTNNSPNGCGAGIGIQNSGQPVSGDLDVDPAGQWIQISTTFVASTSSVAPIFIEISCNYGGVNTIYIDDVTVTRIG
jgi:hypothetical protein